MPLKETDSNFKFSLDRASEAERDIQLQCQAAELRLEKIIRKIQLADHPVIAMLLSVSRDPDELRKVGEALIRVADIIGPLDELRSQISMITYAKEHPDKLKFMFGNFEDDVESLIQSVNKDGQ